MTTSELFEVRGPAGTIVGLDAAPVDGGAGDPVLLIHGINMSRDAWSEIVSLLADTRRLISFDLRGHGQSVKAGPYTAADYAEDALAVLDTLDISRAHVVGTSFGGSVATVLAQTSPSRVASVASFGGTLKPDGSGIDDAMELLRSVGVRAFFAEFLPRGSFAPGTPQSLIDRAVDAAVFGREMDTVIEVILTAFSSDTTAIAKAISVPALVATGDLDVTCPLALGRQLAAALRTELVVLRGVGHVASMEAPAEVADLITRHFAAQEN